MRRIIAVSKIRMLAINVFTAVALAAVIVATPVRAATDDDKPENPDFRTVPVSTVPARILKTARDAKPGVYLVQATEILGPDDETYYEFDGSLVGTYWTIVVRADGELITLTEEEDAPDID